MAATVNLDALLKPGSVAVLGASVRPSIGRSIIESLGTLGFPGEIYPVNPKYDEILGHACYDSLEALPAAPDVVAFCVGSGRILENFRRLPECGAGSAVIYDAGFAEAGPEGRKRQDELIAICRDAGIALLGPNTMGCLSPWNRATTYLVKLRDAERLAGNVGLISQSGSVCIGLLGDIRRFGFSHVISSGNEAVVTTADYIDYLVDDPETRVIATFTETINAPDSYVAALDRAAAAGKPVVVLKVGRSERARRAITSHTGGLAGEAAVFSEVLCGHRAIEVHDLDEMTEVLAACQSARWPQGRRLSVATGSGGHAELMLDLTARAGIELPALPTAQRAEIEARIGLLTGDGNPTDFWGNGDHRTNLSHCLNVLRDGAAYDALVLCMDSHDHDPMAQDAMHECVGLLCDSAARSDLPHYLMGTRPGILDTGLVSKLADAGLATLSGTRQGLLALDRLARWTSRWRGEDAPTVSGEPVLAELVKGSPRRRALHEYDAKCALAAFGLSTVPEQRVASLDEARVAADEIGYPVVLKALGDGLPHKTDLGLLRLDLADVRSLETAWNELRSCCDRLEDRGAVQGFLVQKMVPEGVEVIAGVARDRDFGLTMAFGIGGVAVEILSDVALRLLPLEQGAAEAMIEEIRGAVLLGSVRGGPAADVESLAKCLYCLASFASAHEELIEEIDLNPIKVLPRGEGCVVVDALIVLRDEPSQEGARNV